MGDDIGDYHKDITGNTRSLDSSSYRVGATEVLEPYQQKHSKDLIL